MLSRSVYAMIAFRYFTANNVAQTQTKLPKNVERKDFYNSAKDRQTFDTALAGGSDSPSTGQTSAHQKRENIGAHLNKQHQVVAI